MPSQKRRKKGRTIQAKQPSGRTSAFDAAGFRDRLRRVLAEDFGESRRAFADAIGVYESRLSAWIPKYGESRVETSLPGSGALHRICAASTRSAHWLLFGAGPERPDLTRTQAELEDDVKSYLVPKIATAATGAPWAQVLDDADVDGAKFLSLALAREIARIRAAWASTEEQERYGAEVADTALGASVALSREKPSDPVQDVRRMEASRRIAVEMKRERLFWTWLARGDAGAVVHWAATKPPRKPGERFDLAIHGAHDNTPDAFRRVAEEARKRSPRKNAKPRTPKRSK